MQSTLTSFAELSGWNPLLWGSCSDCHDLRHHIEAGVVYCRAADYHGPVKLPRSCRRWWPAEPMVLWPPLPSNYSTPKKWLHELVQ